RAPCVVHAKNWCAPTFTFKATAGDADGEGGTLTPFREFSVLSWMDGSCAGRWAVRTLALALAYSATARLGWLFATAQTGISPLWPPAGIALATLVLGGRSLWPGVFLGALAGDLSLGIAWPLAVTGAVANTIEPVPAAWLLSRWPGFRLSLGRLRDRTALMSSGALASLLGATVGT